MDLWFEELKRKKMLVITRSVAAIKSGRPLMLQVL